MFTYANKHRLVTLLLCLNTLLVLILGSLAYTKAFTTKEVASDPNKSSTISRQESTSSTLPEGQSELISVGDSGIGFKLPDEWVIDNSVNPPYLTVTVKALVTTRGDGVFVRPGGDILPMGCGTNCTDHFVVGLTVFTNPQKHTARQWFQEDFGNGTETDSDDTSLSTVVNGHDLYVYKSVSIHNTNDFTGEPLAEPYLELIRWYYVLVVGDKIVLVRSDLGEYEYDYTNYEPAILSLVESVTLSE